MNPQQAKIVISRASVYDAHGGEKEQLPFVPPFDEAPTVHIKVRALGHAPTVEQKVDVQVEVENVLVRQVGAPATSCQQLRRTLPGRDSQGFALVASIMGTCVYYGNLHGESDELCPSTFRDHQVTTSPFPMFHPAS